jgi:hypothetical protein
MTTEACDLWDSPAWDRPFDIKAILDWLEQQSLRGPFAGRIDMDAIGIGGHSAGSTGVLSTGGAGRIFAGKRYDATLFSDVRPKAIVALSPAPPGSHYLFDNIFKDGATSWDGITRPVLTCTGAGDAHEQSPRWRRVPFERLPAGEKYRLWVNNTSFGHANYGDNLLDCEGPQCDGFIALMQSTVFAFLDAYVQKLPAAVTYLKSGHVERALRGTGEWAVK